MNKNNIIIIILLLVIFLIGGYFGYRYYVNNNLQDNLTENLPVNTVTAVDPLNATYIVDNRSIKLNNGSAQMETDSASLQKINVSVFGAPIFQDLNNDSVNDAVLILVYNYGGTGTFYSMAAAINDTTNNTTVGTNAILLGDRIAPQNISIGSDKKIEVNYLDRKINEPFSTPPSEGKTKYFSLSGTTLVEDSGK